MKPFVIVFKIVAISILFDFEMVESQKNHSWFEIDKQLYFVEPEGRFTWKQAVAACTKVQSNLIRLKGDYDYAKLKDAVRRNFKSYSSFWSSEQMKSLSFFHHFGMGGARNHQKCYKFDNSSSFKFSPENCNTRLGFICEKNLLRSESLFYNKNMVYFVQPQQSFTCVQAYEQCEKRKMLLVPSKDQKRNKLLNDFLFINYGSEINFWFSFTNATLYNCETMTRNRYLNQYSELGFICQRTRDVKHALTSRHIILLVFVAVAATLAINVFLVVKCFCQKKMKSFGVAAKDIRNESKITDIK